MKRVHFILSVFVLSFLVVACEAADTIRVGAWNIEWLGNPENRSGIAKNVAQKPADLAEYITESGVEILALEEIGDDTPDTEEMTNSTIEKTLEILNENSDQSWEYLLLPKKSPGARSQLTGVAWNTGRATIVGEPLRIDLKDLPNPQGHNTWDRHPHAVKFSLGENKTDLVLIPVHMKSNLGGVAKTRSQRALEARMLVGALDSILEHFEDDDIVVLGDTNVLGADEPAVKTFERAGWLDLNADDAPTRFDGEAPFDRIFVPTDQQEFEQSPQEVLESDNPNAFKKNLSDHYMVVTQVTVHADDDGDVVGPSERIELADAVTSDMIKFAASKASSEAAPLLSLSREDTAAVAPTVFVPPSRLAPELRVKVLVPPGKTLPDAFREFLSDQPRPLSMGFTQYQCAPGIDQPDLRAVVNHPDIDSVEIVRPIVVESFIPRPLNLQARISHLVPQFDSEFKPLGGKGAVVAVFDGGAIRDTHQEFQEDGVSRVSIKTTQPRDEHATHVAGTIGARGVDSDARGMAGSVTLVSYDFLNDTNDLETVANDVCVTNHSYGPVSGWELDREFRVWRWWGDTRLSQTEDAKFGKYGSDNTQVDDFLHRRTNVVTVVAAGNDRNDAPRSQPIQHLAIGVNPSTGQLQWMISNEVRPQDGGETGFDTVSGLGLCKNVICIGAVHDVPSPSATIETTDFSGFGVADDGRIKPDLVANGFQLRSSSSAEDDAYLDLSGTSMASPTASGICALLVELYRKVHGASPTSADIKAALIHSATDAGPVGPDPAFGWGSINALKAGRVIAQKKAVIRKGKVTQSAPQTFVFQRLANQQDPVRVTIVWIDPAAPPNNGGVDDATPTLVNDLDLRLIAPDRSTRFPYSLDVANPGELATTTGPNTKDNVEVVDATPMEGQWTVEVKATDLQSGSEQEFALVVSGMSPQ